MRLLPRAADASKDGFIAFSTGTADLKLAAFPDGWFAASRTADIRLLTRDLAGRLAVAGSKAPETNFKTSCPGAGFLLLDLSEAAVTAVPLPGQGLLRVPSTRADRSLSQMNNYVFGARLDTTRTGTWDAVALLPMPAGVNGFSDASLQQIPTVVNLPVPDGFTTVGPPGGGANAAAGATRLMAANARANIVYAVGYAGNRQLGIIVVRIP